MLKALKLTPMIALLGTLGCSSPKHGSGGFAEHSLGTFLPIEHSFMSKSEQALRLDWESQKHLLDLLILNGAMECFPASVNEAELREARVLRELMAEMYYDASDLLLVQRNKLAILERRLNTVNAHGTCYPKPELSESEQNETKPFDLDALHALLNADNQFAINSAELNPKYQQRLRSAAEIIQTLEDYQVRVSGHTDSHGDNTPNMLLSMRRAKRVADFLQANGISSENIVVSYSGEDDPRYLGAAPHQRLVNRRVDIEIKFRTSKAGY